MGKGNHPLDGIMILLLLLPLLASGTPLEPGQPGGPWTEEEVEIAKEKIQALVNCCPPKGKCNPICWKSHPKAKVLADLSKDLDEFSWPHEEGTLGPRIPDKRKERGPHSRWGSDRSPTVAKLVQLSFHDCLRYEGGGGGCDGCINWKHMGHKPRNGIRAQPTWLKMWKQYPITYSTDNNKLQMTVRSLELIFTETDWPPNTRELPVSFMESGKSRADLWQLAGNTALEMAINDSNANCARDRWHKQQQVVASEGLDKCEFKLDHPVPFQYGRVDCQPDPEKKWTPYPFEATEQERHSNPRGTAKGVLDDLKRDFDMTARETISLMATHGLGSARHNYVQRAKYMWFGGHALSNYYYKYLNGKMYLDGDILKPEFGRPYLIGDKFGQPVGGRGWELHCHGAWNTSTYEAGPCDFRPTEVGCRKDEDPDKDLTVDCFDKVDGVWQRRWWCPEATLNLTTMVQYGGPRMPDWYNSCRHEGWSFGLPFEVNFVVNFTVDGENRPRGCGPLDGNEVPWSGGNELVIGVEDWNIKNKPIYPGSPGFYGSPPCGYQMYAPEGEASADIVAAFADDHDLWARVFLQAWQKMQKNGYSNQDLTNGPSNSWLLSWMEPLNPFTK